MQFASRALVFCGAILAALMAGNSANAQSNPYYNANSQAVADYVATYLYSSEVQMLRTAYEPGCIDSNSAPQGPQVTVPCEDAFWTTSDNNPTCATLADFGYTDISAACLKKIFHDLKFKTEGSQPPQETGAWESGWRYEAYYAIPIPVGSPKSQHFVVTVGTLTTTDPYGCPTPPCSYAIKADTNTGSVGLSNINGPVDIVGPQAINYWLRGNTSMSRAYAQNLVARWDGHGIPQQINYPPYCYPGYDCYSPWELGQVMFVMRVLQLDTSSQRISTAAGRMTYAAVFSAMTDQLWAVQNSDGSLPNEYHADNVGFFGSDAENQDGGLLPFSSTVINRVRNAYGCQPQGNCPTP
jgi:hypothetical protein